MDRTQKQFWKIELSFNNEDDKRDFQQRVDRANESLRPGKPLDNFHQFLSLMLERFESEMSSGSPQATNMPGKHIKTHSQLE